ncbi:MAG: transposase [Armatimonadota bacterium]|nr:transposase [Armatimonadota bacterium]
MERKKRRRAYDAPGDAHELTYSTYRRLPLLERTATKELFLKCLDRARKRLGFRIVAYVVMPEHVHLLVFPDGKPIAAFLTAAKSEFAKQLLCELRAANASILNELRVVRRDGTSTFRVWQAGGGYDRNLFSPQQSAPQSIKFTQTRFGATCATPL